MMKGSHNTLTYGRPRCWWGWLLLPLWRCQCRSLDDQIGRGCRVFDIRVVRRKGIPSFYGHYWIWCSAHGVVDVDVDPMAAIAMICANVKSPCIRVVLERGNAKAEHDFVDLCETLERCYPQARFFGGVSKRGWVQLYKFAGDDGNLERSMVQHVGSMQSRYGKLLPGLWARFHRHDIPVHGDNIVLVDMV